MILHANAGCNGSYHYLAGDRPEIQLVIVRQWHNRATIVALPKAHLNVVPMHCSLSTIHQQQEGQSTAHSVPKYLSKSHIQRLGIPMVAEKPALHLIKHCSLLAAHY